jgi:cardiolipin synthase
VSDGGHWRLGEARRAEGCWRPGNRIELLENGEEFFARAFAAIAAARSEILIETFILFEDKVGNELHRLLVDAARRGVRVELTVDGYGSPSFSDGFLAALADAGVRFRAYDHRPTLLGVRTNVFRRLHRKLLVVDGKLAFVGGINFSADHLTDFGPAAKQDYAVELEGPIVADIRGFALAALESDGTGRDWRPAATAAGERTGDADAMLLLRDNARRSTSIEHEYRRAIRAARNEVVIANAYFFPGYGFLRDLRHAARRGVRVSLLVQGEPDTPLALRAARTLYPHLVEAGVCIHEYCQRPFHGKVAWVDDAWATVGSSNLDPLSLSLNLEANVFVRSPAFNRALRARIGTLIEHHCRAVDPAGVPRRTLWQRLTRPLLFHVLRRFPRWAGLLPAHTPRVALLRPPEGPSA